MAERRLPDGTWVDGGTGEPVSIARADELGRLWTKWRSQVPDEVRWSVEGHGDQDEGGSGDRVPRNPGTGPVPASAIARDEPRNPSDDQRS